MESVRIRSLLWWTEGNTRVERKKDEYLLSVFHWSVGSLTLCSYVVPPILSNMGVILLILYWWPGDKWLFKLLLKIGRRQWHPTPVLLPGKSHGWRSLVGCSPDSNPSLHGSNDQTLYLVIFQCLVFSFNDNILYYYFFNLAASGLCWRLAGSCAVVRGLSSCGTRARKLCRMGLVAPWHVES